MAVHESSHQSQSNRPPRSLPRRIGCALLLAIWFTLLLAPCALFYLATNGEIRFMHADVPQPHEHPRLLISLISESSDRGLRIESSTITADIDLPRAVCIETTVRFLFWQASGGNQDTSYCDCYHRAELNANWQLSDTYSGACQGR